MTDVLIESFTGAPRVRIKCNNHVRLISVYESLVAVQVNDSFTVYERTTGSADDAQYTVKALVHIKKDCDLLQVISSVLMSLCCSNQYHSSVHVLHIRLHSH